MLVTWFFALPVTIVTLGWGGVRTKQLDAIHFFRSSYANSTNEQNNESNRVRRVIKMGVLSKVKIFNDSS